MRPFLKGKYVQDKRLAKRGMLSSMLSLFNRTLLCWAMLLIMSGSVWAMVQCPAELGPKDPSINVFGWLLVLGGASLGMGVLGYTIKRSRGARLLTRIVIIMLATVFMLLVSIYSLVLAIGWFFLQC